MTICDVSDCKHNDRKGTCQTEPVIHNGRCVSVVTDMGYLRENWVYVKGREFVAGNRPAYSPDAVEDVEAKAK